jgi:hypothetical protein
MLRKGMILAALLLHMSAAATAPSCVPFVGGPAEGMCAGPVISNDGTFAVVSLLPAARPGGPIPSEEASVLSRFLESERAQTAFDPALFAANGVATFCPALSGQCSQSWPLKSWLLGPDLLPSVPFKLSDGRIRIEWAKNGRIEYLSLLKFEGPKIANIWILPASIAVKLRS